jgi:precorrin-6B methylase 2
LRLPPDTTWETIPPALLDDLSQLVKANSIDGNKKDNQQIIYTPWSNIKKTGDLAVGTVTFHNERKVR